LSVLNKTWDWTEKHRLIDQIDVRQGLVRSGK
jgi:hypothetical protein